MAKQAMELAKNQVLIQASQSTLAQANNLPQSVLELIK
jgi:flagellin-like hook-associated protein FlgL